MLAKWLLVLGVAALAVTPISGAFAAPLPDFDTWWNYDDPKATEARFRTLLPTAQSSGSAGYWVELLTQVARTQGLQQQFPAALATLDQAEALIVPGLERAKVRCLLERGRVFNSSKRQDQAKPLFLAAWELARTQKLDGLAVDAAHMVAIVESPDQALVWNLKAVELIEASQDAAAKKWRGSLYNNLGWTYHDDLKDYETALRFFQKALAAREEQQQSGGILSAKWCVARALRSLGRMDEAMDMQRALEKAHEAAKTPDGYVFEEIGELLLAKHRSDEAKSYFAQAYGLLAQDTWLVQQEPKRVERLKALGGLP